MTTEGWMVVCRVDLDQAVRAGLRLAIQGVRNQHRCEVGIRVQPRNTNEFEIKRNKAHGGCLGIERR